MLRLPGLIDIHVHMREPGETQKEDWDSGTAAALAGGFTQVLAMPNTKPPIIDEHSLSVALDSAKQKARCDHGQYLGATTQNSAIVNRLASRAAGLKMYLDQTYGALKMDDMALWMEHFRGWSHSYPIAVHAEGRSLAAAILLSALFDRQVHLCHVSRREEILLIRQAKERGLKVTCEVAPHHLFLTQADIPQIGKGKSEVRPELAGSADTDALWAHLEVIDCFATDHAPHTLEEKESANPPPGFPGLETALPLFLTAISQDRLSLDAVVSRFVTNPRRIFSLPEQRESWIEVDPHAAWEIHASENFTRCGWTPFEGFPVRGRLLRVYLRDRLVFDDGRILAGMGSGRNVRREK
jgi:carbamoyl-phosphate synthase/aspartate carbamoyltransferase/dihydroorotase